DEDSQVFVGVPPAPKYDADFDESPAPVPQPAPARLDIPAKPALVVGIAQARRSKRVSAVAPSGSPRGKPPSAPPPIPRTRPPMQQPPPVPAIGRTKNTMQRKAMLPSPFNEPTRAVNDDELIKALRSAPGPGRTAFDEPTRAAGGSDFDDSAT